MKRIISVGFARLLVLSFLGSIGLTVSHAEVTVSGIEYVPVRWGPSLLSTNMIDARFSWENTTSGPDFTYVNVYNVSNGAWLVRNLPLGGEPGAQVTATTLDSSLVAMGSNYVTTTSDVPVASFNGLGVPTLVGGGTYTANTDPIVPTLGFADFQSNNPAGKAGAGIISSFDAATWSSPSFGPLGDFVYHTGMPDTAQGLNECGPTSAANSLRWLADKNGYSLDYTAEAIRDELKDSNHMKTNDGQDGTTDENFVAGKDAYVNDPAHPLPIETHLIGGGPDLPGRTSGLDFSASFGNIVAEMKAGQDVELSVLWEGGGGHWVTLVGAVDLFGARGFFYNDPDDKVTGTRFSWLTEDEDGFLHLDGMSQNTVDIVVAESPVPEPSTYGMVAAAALLVLAWRRRSVR